MKIAVIPARGGSKRIPGKNIKLFHGKPIIAYSIEAALASACFDKVIVSTDDADIAKVALAYGAEVPFVRPTDIADDHATTMDVIQHAIEWCQSQGMSVDLLCCIYATAPFISADDLIKGLTLVSAGDIDYAFSATSFAFPIQRAISLNDNGSVQMLQPEHVNARSQDLQEAFHDAGQFYWGKVSAFEAGRPFFSLSSKAILIPRKRVQDVDTFEDWEFAEALYAVMQV
ncbi:pseudaminic acid cytidylyltransferase [Moritella sp. F3]|uniref:pseudaminic acid cytidylyltransferase n=1 Tax=Moritella sp. F3 TaxID=2718882 RepID=UPI0018E14FF9|nr:pseudaminic acid cytidylyltransferase [Moritella sp. F3]GIC77290.1 pseudaminic acid cytidylyltransferase [Moritella sp. F1]GIC83182.1 pseudaminic acid cytidylyltransferase [Moritella sp. F3]